MEFRIRAFDNVYRERLLVRLFAIGPDQDPDDHRVMLAELIIPPPQPLVRQTNRHHLLPADKLERFWTGTGEERQELMDEFEAGEVSEPDDDLPEDDEERAVPIGPTVYQDDAGALYYYDGDPLAYDEDAGEVYDTLLLE